MWGEKVSPVSTVCLFQKVFFGSRETNQLINDFLAMQSASSMSLTGNHSSEINERQRGKMAPLWSNPWSRYHGPFTSQKSP